MGGYVWRATVHGSPPRTVDIAEGTTRIGTSADCEIAVSDPTVDEIHAVLVRAGDDLTVRDDGSRSGSTLDAVPLRRGVARIVLSGAELRLGKLLVELKREADDAAHGTTRELALALVHDDRGPEIVVVEGKDAGTRVPLRALVRVGRSSRVELVLHDAAVSQEHVDVKLDSGRAMVFDRGSKHGTLLGVDAVPAGTWRIWNRSTGLAVGDSVLTIIGVEPERKVQIATSVDAGPVGAPDLPAASSLGLGAAPIANAPVVSAPSASWRVPWTAIVIGALSLIIVLAVAAVVWIVASPR